MKRILITGAGSYIGEKLAARLDARADWEACVLDMIDPAWRSFDFAGFDAVVHVAGIVHQKERPDMQALYDSVNRDLPLEVARRALDAGVQQFVFMSTISVYGIHAGRITPDTPEAPVTMYGHSKLAAEAALNALRAEGLRVAVLRPPMVYGPGCRGNGALLEKLLRRVPLFPDFDNRRSMVHVDVLTAFIERCIERCDDGLFFPQDPEYRSTRYLTEQIAAWDGLHIRYTRAFNPLIRLLRARIGPLQKLFGDLTVEIPEER